MYYKVFTSNGDFEIGYLYNITDIEQIRSYLLWEADNQYNDDTLDDDRYEAKVAKIKAMSFLNLGTQEELKQEFVDGFVDKLYVTSSKEAFAINLIDESQRDLVGNAPWV